MSDEDSECEGCEHLVALHYNDVRGVVRCLNVERGTSSRGIIGLPYEVRCDCKDYVSHSLQEKRNEDNESGDRFQRRVRELIRSNQ